MHIGYITTSDVLMWWMMSWFKKLYNRDRGLLRGQERPTSPLCCYIGNCYSEFWWVTVRYTCQYLSIHLKHHTCIRAVAQVACTYANLILEILSFIPVTEYSFEIYSIRDVVPAEVYGGISAPILGLVMRYTVVSPPRPSPVMWYAMTLS